MTEVNVLSPAEAVYWANQWVLEAGTPVNARGRETREIQNFSMHVHYPHLSPLGLGGRGARPAIGAVEALQLVGQVPAPETTVRVSSKMAPYTNDGIFWGAYGQRAYGQLARAERLLADDPGTRQAVVSIYDGPRDLGAGTADIPCTLTLQFLWQPGVRLGMRVSMRSNDAWLGLPYDLFQFTALQHAMADALGVDPGTYVHTVGSMHLYDEDIEKAGGLVAPGEPTADETRYAPRWGAVGAGIGVVSERARTLLSGSPVPNMTEYEGGLLSALQEAGAW